MFHDGRRVGTLEDQVAVQGLLEDVDGHAVAPGCGGIQLEGRDDVVLPFCHCDLLVDRLQARNVQ